MKVWNKRDPNTPNDAVYVGRPTKWGNPFSHLPSKLSVVLVDGRTAAITLYTLWLAEDEQKELVAAAKAELRGKDLVCWCAPKPCHADILIRIANDVGLRGQDQTLERREQPEGENYPKASADATGEP